MLKHVHHSVNINDIKIELEGKGHAVRNMMNGRHWRTKKPLNLFFIDLEPAENNTEVFRIQRLLNLAVVILPTDLLKLGFAPRHHATLRSKTGLLLTL